MQVKNQLFEEITKEYSLQILKWAYKKCGDSDRAEELTQEVMVQIFSAIQKSAAEGKRIEQVEHFVWKIARYVWCHSLRKSTRYVMCSLEGDLRDDSDFAGELAEREEREQMIVQLRKQVSRLNYLQREILVSFYIDGLPQKTIAERLGISESAVKWHLHDTRQKLKKEMAEDMRNQSEQNYVYRPGKLSMAINGEMPPKADIGPLEDSMVRQNLCIACYEEPKSLDELTEHLGIPKAYLEFDLQWLVDREFMSFENGRYATTFYINSETAKQECYKVYCGLREQVSDVIVKGLLDAEDKIRAVGFHGSDMPMEKLLWLLIYVFCDYYQYEDGDLRLEKPIRPDGGKYFPLGYLEDSDKIKEWALDNRDFAYCGPARDGGFSWFGLYNFGYSEILDLMDQFTPESERMNELLVELVNKDFDISYLGEDRKCDLAKLVEQGYVKLHGDKAVPQFVVMSGEQLNRLYDEVFAPIAEKLQPGYTVLKVELKKLYGEKMPKHLKEVSRLPFVQALYAMEYVTTLLAFKENLLYVPKDSKEGEFLTLMYVDWER